VTARLPLSRFALALGAIIVVAFGMRLWYDLAFAPSVTVGGDGKTYHWLANLIAGGHGFIRPWDYTLDGIVRPTAEHPPLYPLLLAGVSKLGWTSWTAHRIASGVMGTAAVLVIGLVGRRVAGRAAGLAAAGLAAVYPLLVVSDGTLYSESLYVLTIALTLLAAYRFRDRPTWRRAALVGGAIGLAALTRAEALLLFPLLVLPIVWPLGVARRRHAAAGLAALALVVSPWLVRNWVTFGRPILSDNLGGLVAGANCHATYYGAFTGLWRYDCFGKVKPGNEAYEADQYRDRGLRYAREHAARLLVVVPIRVLRTWDLWRPRQAATYESFVEGRDRSWEKIGTAFYLLLVAPLALAGAWILRRRGQQLRILLAPALLVSISSATSYGITRFRSAADVVLVVAAGVTLAAAREQLPALRARLRPGRLRPVGRRSSGPA
jgi:4-amino-4-deoxy-L-arabinose transferase-like glycosyltransferase